MIFTIASTHISICYFSCVSCLLIYCSKLHLLPHFDFQTIIAVFFTTLSENGLPQRQAVGAFDVCLAGPKDLPQSY